MNDSRIAYIRPIDIRQGGFDFTIDLFGFRFAHDFAVIKTVYTLTTDGQSELYRDGDINKIYSWAEENGFVIDNNDEFDYIDINE